MDDPGMERFITGNTEVATSPLVPEIPLRLASRVVPLWQATERMLAAWGVAPPYWAFCWPGGQALARFLLDHPAHVAGRRVLDFAAGCGIAAIAAARSGGRASANEIDPLALAAIRLNAGLNGQQVMLRPGDLIGMKISPAYDLLLAGDVCYERTLAGRVIPWLRSCAGRGLEVLLSDPGRSYLPRTGLEPIGRYVVPTSLELEDREQRECTIWRVLS